VALFDKCPVRIPPSWAVSKVNELGRGVRKNASVTMQISTLRKIIVPDALHAMRLGYLSSPLLSY